MLRFDKSSLQLVDMSSFVDYTQNKSSIKLPTKFRWDLNGCELSNVGDPTSDKSAVNSQYLESCISDFCTNADIEDVLTAYMTFDETV